jgi:hypothetical protein
MLADLRGCLASMNSHGTAVHETGLVAREEKHDTRNLDWLSCSFERVCFL